MEFALILPVLLIVTLAVADFGRVYASIIALEAGVREAADFAAFSPENWTSAEQATTESELVRRACTAVRQLPDYVGAADGSNCTNPTITWALEHSAGPATPAACSVSNLVPPCQVHVTGAFEFETLIRFPLIPETVDIVRDSIFAITELPDPALSPSPEVTFELPTPAPTASPTPDPSP